MSQKDNTVNYSKAEIKYSVRHRSRFIDTMRWWWWLCN